MPQTRLSDWMELAQRVVMRTIDRLPPEIAPLAHELPVIYARKPDPEDGDDTILGLFCGPTINQDGGDSAPATVTLYLENIADYTDYNTAAFREEVALTYLHELGHYLDLDEEDLWLRGLD
jgi:predicted Zn-dependent protease with MMP-like domain